MNVGKGFRYNGKMLFKTFTCDMGPTSVFTVKVVHCVTTLNGYLAFTVNLYEM